MLLENPDLSIRTKAGKLGIDFEFATVLLYDKLPEDYLKKIPFERLVKICQRAPKRSKTKGYILKRLWSLAKTSEERLEVYRQSDPKSQLEKFILKELWGQAKTLNERFEVCKRTVQGSELEKIAVKYMANQEAPFNQWLEIYNHVGPGRLRDLAFKKMKMHIGAKMLL